MSRVRLKSVSSNGTAKPLASLKPTDIELAILQVLWRKGPCVLGEIHNEIPRVPYTVVRRYLQLMVEKGMVRTEQPVRHLRYEAVHSEDDMQKHLASTLLKKVFGGSPLKFLNQFLASNRTTPEELAAIKRLCDQHKKN